MKNTLEILQYMESLFSNYLKLLSHFDKERFLDDKNYSIVQFFDKWGLERAGSPKMLKIADIKFLSLYLDEFQDEDFKKTFIEKYKTIAGTENINEKVNPLMDEKILIFNPQETVQLIQNKKIKDAFDSIQLKGLGHKIKSFFLRDMTLLYLDNTDFTIEELLYLFPIDVWIKEFISGLKIEPMEEYPREKQYDNLKKEDRELGFDFIHYCINNNLDIRKLDAGIWFYCARVVGSKERLKYLLNQDSANILKEEYQLRFKYCPDM